MQLSGKIVVVTGGANGIGAALCRRFASEGAEAVIIADLQRGPAEQVAKEIGGVAAVTDVSREGDVERLVEFVTEKYGRIDLFCSNAGLGVSGSVDAPDVDWQRSW